MQRGPECDRSTDYILIDSRTGVSDTSGISTVQMPDTLVVCFTLNNQGIEGAAAVANSVYEQRKTCKLRVLPVPMRVDPFEKKKLDLRKAYAESKFSEYPDHLNPREREEYRGQMQFPYKPYYAYEEILATFGDRSGESNTLLEAAERLASHVSGETMRLAEPTEEERQRVLAQYEVTPLALSRYDLLLNFGPGDEEWASHLVSRVERENWKGRRLRVFFAPRDIRPGESVSQKLAQAMANSRKIGIVLSPSSKENSLSPFQAVEKNLFESWKSAGRLLPLLRGDCETPAPLRALSAIDFRDGTDVEGATQILLAVIKDEPLPRTVRPSLASLGMTKTSIPGDTKSTSKTAAANKNPVDAAKAALKSKTIAPGDAMKLVKSLKKARCFGYARRILELALTNPQVKETQESSLKFAQQLALCTYKDVDLPLSKRLEEALKILQQTEGFGTTKDQETLGLTGAVHKRKWEVDGQKQHLERALGYYQRGYREGVASDYGYTAINAAFILDLIASLEAAEAVYGTTSERAESMREEARYIRKKIVSTLAPMIDEFPEQNLDSAWWFLVTLAEAHFGLQEYEAALHWLQKAAALPDIPSWEFETTTRQLATLARLHGLQNASDEERQDSPAWRVLKLFLGDNTAGVRTAFMGKVGLALSGGGFRASLYHIGVLARLADLDMLRYVEVLSCVSGGSVIGAHYYLELRKLLRGKADDEITRRDYIDLVDRISRDFVAGVQRNVRTRVLSSFTANVKMILFPNEYSRTERLGELLESEIFSRVDDGEGHKPRWLNELFIHPKGEAKDFSPKYDNWRRSAKVPMLILNATTLNTGHNWQFTASWMGEPPSNLADDIDNNERLRRVYYKDAPPRYQRYRLGHAVAASACVPGLFEPIVLADLYPERTVRLVDGGVHDNQGIVSLLEQDCTVQLVSDSSGQMYSDRNPSNGVLGVPLRSISITMSRVRSAEFYDLAARRRASLLRGLMFIHLKKDLTMPAVRWLTCDEPPETVNNKTLTNYGLRKDVQEKVAALRTDLDSFSTVEAHALMTSGYRMTEAEYARSVPGFPKVEDEAAPWKFLAVEEPMKQVEPGEKLNTLLRLLEVGSKKAFKVWMISPSMQVVAGVLGVVAAGVLIWAMRKWWSFPLVTVGTIGSFLGTLALTAIFGKSVLRVARFRETLAKIATGLGMSVAGSLVALLHLHVFDPLFLKLSTLDRPLAKPRAKMVALVLFGVALAVGGFAWQWWQSDSYQIRRILKDAPVSEALETRAIGVDRVSSWAAALANFGEADAADQSWQIAKDSTSRLSEDLDRAKALAGIGRGFEEAGELSQAQNIYKAAFSSSQNIRDDSKRLWAMANYSRLLGQWGDTNGSETGFSNALDAARRLPRPEDQVWAFTTIFTNVAWSGKSSLSNLALTEAHNSIARIKLPEDQVWALNIISRGQAQVGDVGGAQRTLENASHAANQIEAGTNRTWAFARVNQNSAEVQARVNNVNQALTTAREISDPTCYAEALIGVIQEINGDEFALARAEQEVRRDVSDPVYRSEALSLVAGKWISLNKSAQAKKSLSEALSAARQIPRVSEKSSALASVGKGYARLKLFREAREAAEECNAADRLDVYTAILNASSAGKNSTPRK